MTTAFYFLLFLVFNLNLFKAYKLSRGCQSFAPLAIYESHLPGIGHSLCYHACHYMSIPL
jgi:hypothetical protein